MRLKMKERWIVYLSVIAESDAIFADQIPWRPYLRPRIEVAGWPERSSKDAQEESAPGVERARRSAVEERPAQAP